MSAMDRKQSGDAEGRRLPDHVDVHLMSGSDADSSHADGEAFALCDRLLAAARAIHAGEADQTRASSTGASWTLPDGFRVTIERHEHNLARMTEKLILHEPPFWHPGAVDQDASLRPAFKIVACDGDPNDEMPTPRDVLVRALQGRAALQAIVDGDLLHWNDPIFTEVVREISARALGHVEDDRTYQVRARPSTPWGEGTCTATFGQESERRRSGDPTHHPIAIDRLPTMAIVSASRDQHARPFVAMRPVWLLTEGIEPDRSPMERLRDSAQLEALLERIAARRQAAQDGDPS